MNNCNDYSIDFGKKLIVIKQFNYNSFRKYMDWARDNPDMYYVFNAGIIKCRTEYSMEWFLLKWA